MDKITGYIIWFLGIFFGAFIFPIGLFEIGFLLSKHYFKNKKRHKYLSKASNFDKRLVSVILIFIGIAIFPIGFFESGWLIAQRKHFKNMPISEEFAEVGVI